MIKRTPPDRIWAYDDGAHILAFDYETTLGGAIEYVCVDEFDALKAEVERLTKINAALMGDDEDAPRYTTKRFKQEVAKAVERALSERAGGVKVKALDDLPPNESVGAYGQSGQWIEICTVGEFRAAITTEPAAPEGRHCMCARSLTDSPCIVCGKPKLITREWAARMAEREGDADATTAAPEFFAENAKKGQEGRQEAVARHPLEAYADSYAQMSRMGDGKVDCRSVEVDIRQNMIPATHPAEQAVTEMERAKREAIDALIQADDVWTDYGSGFRVHFSFNAGSGLMEVVERINTARSLKAAMEAGR